MSIADRLENCLSPHQLRRELMAEGYSRQQANKAVSEAMLEVFPPMSKAELKSTIELNAQRLDAIADSATRTRDKIYAVNSAASIRLRRLGQ